jgi:DNA-binding CsgD family transcriptional regulator
MPKNFSQIVESKSNIIRGMIYDNKTDTQIINELKMPVHTFYSYKKRIQKHDAQIW